jgi:uncharacterized membrane protein YebE (DUF533 family)
MNQSNHDNIGIDHSFSVFSLGLVIGAVGALLLGTREGRKLTREILNTLPEVKIGDTLEEAKETVENIKEKIEEVVTPPPPPPLPKWPTTSPQYFS